MQIEAMMLVAIIYVTLQGAMVFKFSGFWQFAAALPVPVMCLLLVLSVAGGMFGVPGTEIVVAAMLPGGLVYLLLLAGLIRLSRALSAEAG